MSSYRPFDPLHDDPADRPRRAGVFMPPQTVTDEEAERLRLRNMIRAKQRARQERALDLAEDVHAQRTVFCTVCGDDYRPGNRHDVIRSRKCPACVEVGNTSGDTRYCRTCGAPMFKADYVAAGMGDTSKGWGTLSTCSGCKDASHKHWRALVAQAKDRR